MAQKPRWEAEESREMSRVDGSGTKDRHWPLAGKCQLSRIDPFQKRICLAVGVIVASVYLFGFIYCKWFWHIKGFDAVFLAPIDKFHKVLKEQNEEASQQTPQK
jgi:hypothetical protein